MGALHSGHVSLVERSLQDDAHYTVVSIFVNPSQFAPGEDLDSYPRTWDSDYSTLVNLLQRDTKTTNSGGSEASSSKNDKKRLVIFAPTVSEMYPSGITLNTAEQRGTFIEVLGPSGPLEGESRPSFFRGVCTVVLKLFCSVQCNVAYFGQKDIQQCIVVKRMVSDLLLDLEIVVMPIVREVNGLAKSSRNQYLEKDSFERSALIYKALKEGVELSRKGRVGATEVVAHVKSLMVKDEVFEVDYISVNEPVDLQTRIGNVEKGDVLSLAVFVNQGEGKQRVRLIDNIIV